MPGAPHAHHPIPSAWYGAVDLFSLTGDDHNIARESPDLN